MDIAMVDGSHECTKEVHANATKISQSNDIVYGTEMLMEPRTDGIQNCSN